MNISRESNSNFYARNMSKYVICSYKRWSPVIACFCCQKEGNVTVAVVDGCGEFLITLFICCVHTRHVDRRLLLHAAGRDNAAFD